MNPPCRLTRRVRLYYSLLLCGALLVTNPALALRRGSDAPRQPTAKASPAVKPAPGLPNLDDVKRRAPAHPKAPEPIASKRRKCPPDRPDCNAAAGATISQRADAEQPSPAAAPLSRGLLTTLASLTNPYAGLQLASAERWLPAPPPARSADASAADGKSWLASFKGLFGATAAVVQSQPEGAFETATCDALSGWAWDSSQPDQPVIVSVFADGQFVTSALADQYRADLAASTPPRGDGRHGFQIAIPDALRDGNSHQWAVQLLGAQGTGALLPGSPRTLACALPDYHGQVTGAACDQIVGWAWDALRPSTPVSVDVSVDGAFQSRVAADIYTSQPGLGDGRHQFRLATPASLRDWTQHAVSLRIAGTTTELAASPVYLTCGGADYHGSYMGADGSYIYGWAWDAQHASARVSVDVLADGNVVARALADNYRPELAAAGIGDGRYGFQVPVPDALRDGLPHTLTARVSANAQPLDGSGTASWAAGTGTCGAAQSLAAPEFVRQFYLGALARGPRAAELQYWTDALRTAAAQSAAVRLAEAQRLGRELFLQAEYGGRNRPAAQLIPDLYWGYLQRGPDAAGLNYWLAQVNPDDAAHRLTAVEAFQSSSEFAARVASLCPAAPESVSGYDAARDFSPLQNGDGAWSYGYRAPGGAFTPDAAHSNLFGAGAESWSRDSSGAPHITHNSTGGDYQYPNATSVVQPASMLNLQPGAGGEQSVLRWTAPVTGKLLVQGGFRALDAVGTTTDVSVVLDGTPLFSSTVTGAQGSAPFSLDPYIVAGDTLEFRVGWGADGSNAHDSTGLSVDISALPPVTTHLPYGGHASMVPGAVEAELYDEGAAETAYHDTTAGTHGQDYDQPPSYPPPSFRQPTDVDIYHSSSGYSNGYVVVMQAGDWMNYTVDVARTGLYTFEAQTYYWGGVGGTFHLEADGADVTGPLTLPGGNLWRTLRKTGVQLSAGRHTLRVVADENAADGSGYLGDLDYFRLTEGDDPALAGHWSFDEQTGTTTADVSGHGYTGTLQAPSWAPGKVGAGALSFNGASDRVAVTNAQALSVVKNNFTISFWAFPRATHEIDAEGAQYGGVSGQRYAWGPQSGGASDAGAGISVGTNGVSVYEHGENYLPARLVYPGTLNGWTHVTLVYENKRPSIYLNGNLVRTGTVSPRANVIATPSDIGGMVYGYFDGLLDDVRLYARALDAGEVQALAAGDGTDTSALKDNYAAARLDPINETGAGGDDPLSRNFNWSAPLVALKGRAGLDLSLSLVYNSLVWTKDAATNSLRFDADDGEPSPGFHLGLPAIEPLYRNARGQNAYLLVTATGGHVELAQVAGTKTYEASDSSYLQLVETGAGLVLRTPDGAQLSFAPAGGKYQLTRIEDRNGNYISVTYNAAGHVSTLTDTLGRVVSFSYDAYQHPLEIAQTWNGQTHRWATFGYTDLQMAPAFDGSLSVHGPAPGAVISVLSQVGLGDGSRYLFSYNSYGQVYRITHAAPDGRLLASTEYDLAGPAAGQQDCPRFTERREKASDWNDGHEAVTTYSVGPSGEQVIDTPDGVRQKLFYGAAGTWQRGLVTSVETLSLNAQSQYEPRRTQATQWTQDDESLPYVQNPRVRVSEVSDPQGNHTGTTYAYTSYGLATDLYEWSQSSGNVLRRTHRDYNLDPEYVGRRVLGLVSSESVYDGSGNIASKVDYTYDQGGAFLQYQGEPVQHDGAAYGAAFVTGRGLVTSIRRWDMTAPNEITKAVEVRVGYNTTGAPILNRDAAGHESGMSYTDSFSERAGTNTLAYPTRVTDADGFSSTVQYSFDTGAVARTQDAKGAQQSFTYDAVGRIVRVERSAPGAGGQALSGGYTRWVYSEALDAVQAWTVVEAGQPETCSIEVLDGAGRVRATASDFPNSQGGYRAARTTYDVAGRVVRQTNPTEVTGAWVPAGDDAGVSAVEWYATAQTYDWKGRPLVTTLPATAPGATSPVREMSYDGCGCAGGETLTTRDEVGRQQVTYHDPLGRAVRVAEFNPTGGVYRTTTTRYDALDHPTRTRVYQGAIPETEPLTGTNYQEATLTYDGHGRLLSRHAPAQVDASNQPLATTYDYNPDDTLRRVTDARGATVTYEYNGRHLPTSISYGAPDSSGISVPARTTFTYDAVGNRLSQTEDGTGAGVSYTYDGLSRLRTEARRFPGLSATYTLSYDYTLGGLLKHVTDLFSNTGFDYDFDAAGQLTGVGSRGLGATAPIASNARYRAWGALKQADYGDTTGVHLSYDGRLLLKQYILSGVRSAETGAVRPEGADLRYYADGRVKFSSDYRSDAESGGLHDRAYAYDQVGRLLAAYTGAEARDFINGTNSATGSVPYRLSYSYDEWDNLTGRTGRYWSQDESGSDTYDARDRNPLWTYDADGRLLSRNEEAPDTLPFVPVSYSYDAAGRPRQQTQTTSRSIHVGSVTTTTFTRTDDYDADGQQVRRVETRQVNGQTPTATATYYLRSSLLGGQVVTEYNTQGVRKTSYALAGAQVLAQQTAADTSSPRLVWRHAAPVTGEVRETDSTGRVAGEMHPDPEGVDTGTADPFTDSSSSGSGLEVDASQAAIDRQLARLIPGYGRTLRCAVDGFLTGCRFASNVMRSEAGVMVSGDAPSGRFIRVTNLSNGQSTYRWAPLTAIAGTVGYLPLGAHLVGSNTYAINLREIAVAGSNVWGEGHFGIDVLQNPQNQSTPQQVMVPIGGVDKLRELLENSLSYGDCKAAIAKVIRKIADITGLKASHTDVMELFNMMTSQTKGGGIYLDFISTQMNQHIPAAARTKELTSGGSGLSWIFSAGTGTHTGTAPADNFQRITTIFLKGAYSNSAPLAFARLPYDYVVTSIHELIHDAPENKITTYDHPEMDKAARALGSDNIDDYIKEHCIPTAYR